MAMSRTDRAMAASLDRALRDREKTHRVADERALQRLHAAGFGFQTIAQAITYQAQLSARAQASAAFMDMHDEISRRKAS